MRVRSPGYFIFTSNTIIDMFTNYSSSNDIYVKVCVSGIAREYLKLEWSFDKWAVLSFPITVQLILSVSNTFINKKITMGIILITNSNVFFLLLYTWS